MEKPLKLSRRLLCVFLLAVSLLLSACFVPIQEQEFIDNQEEIAKYIKILDCQIEKAPGENTITSSSKAVVKFQNVSDRVLNGAFIYVDYLDKEDKPVGGVLLDDMLQGKVCIPPNHIEVGRQELSLGSPDPEDIYGKEWDGSVQPRILVLWVAKQTPGAMPSAN